MLKFITKYFKSSQPQLMNDDHNLQGVNKFLLDGKDYLFTSQLMASRKALETAYGDKKLELWLYEQIVRESYGQPDRESFILEELAFETKVVEVGGFWKLSAMQAGDIAQHPQKWEARAVRKRD